MGIRRVENMCGGKGHVIIKDILEGDELKGKCGLYAQVTIEKGCSLGYHEHHGETETYYILSLIHIFRNPYDPEPEEEALIGRYFKEEYDADFVFVTHYPSKKRPFYAMDDPADEKFTLSFDLLFKGLEVTTGGQRIHDYQMLDVYKRQGQL